MGRPVASLKRAGGAPVTSKGAPNSRGGGSRRGFRNSRGGSRRGFRNSRGGGVGGEVLAIRGGGGSWRSFTNSRGVVGGEGALGGRHSAGGGALSGGHSPGGTHRGLLSGGALNGKHSGGNIQRGGTPLQRGARPQNAPPWLRAWLWV